MKTLNFFMQEKPLVKSQNEKEKTLIINNLDKNEEKLMIYATKIVENWDHFEVLNIHSHQIYFIITMENLVRMKFNTEIAIHYFYEGEKIKGKSFFEKLQQPLLFDEKIDSKKQYIEIHFNENISEKLNDPYAHTVEEIGLPHKWCEEISKILNDDGNTLTIYTHSSLLLMLLDSIILKNNVGKVNYFNNGEKIDAIQLFKNRGDLLQQLENYVYEEHL